MLVGKSLAGPSSYLWEHFAPYPRDREHLLGIGITGISLYRCCSISILAPLTLMQGESQGRFRWQVLTRPIVPHPPSCRTICCGGGGVAGVVACAGWAQAFRFAAHLEVASLSFHPHRPMLRDGGPAW